MSIIALTGGIAAGKSAACTRFASLGVPVIDTDKISHVLTGRNGGAIPLIRKAFGDHYINEDTSLDRKKMRDLVFSNTNAKVRLESIIHPLIRKEVTLLAELNSVLLTLPESTVHYQVIAVPLLFETKLYTKLASASDVIDCEPELQISRAMQRNQLSRETVEAIISTQIAREERLALANYVIENNHDINDLNVKIDALHPTLNQFCRTMQPHV